MLTPHHYWLAFSRSAAFISASTINHVSSFTAGASPSAVR